MTSLIKTLAATVAQSLIRGAKKIPIVRDWILEHGVWDDKGEWKDDHIWKDAP